MKRENKRAIAFNIVQQIHNLRPPGRFLIEDKTGDNSISSNNRASQYDDTVHPLLLTKAWVQVASDKVMVKVMHRLREKDKKDKTEEMEAFGSNNMNDEMESFSSNSLNDMNENLVKLMEHIGNDLSKQNNSTGEEDKSVGQYDDLFDDAAQEPTNEGGNDVGQFDYYKGENVAGGQFDGVFDYTGDNNEATLEGERRSLDELNSYLNNFNLGYEGDVRNEQHLVHELTMQQWVIGCRSKILPMNGDDTSQTSSDQGLGHIKATLPMAIKLTDFLIEAEKEEQN